uniref:Ig-like domain-containing protein n=1 Tax=Timema monikensis TaxID=170555 RepID=A0A7R9E894_9NEOP|nr:unnamed protein product [Timema monikensis]
MVQRDYAVLACLEDCFMVQRDYTVLACLEDCIKVQRDYAVLACLEGRIRKIKCNATQVTLRNVQLSVSGKYSCEVSADAPSFHTALVTGEMDVVGEFCCQVLSVLSRRTGLHFVFSRRTCVESVLSGRTYVRPVLSRRTCVQSMLSGRTCVQSMLSKLPAVQSVFSCPEVPIDRPVITGVRPRYKPGEVLHGNCSSSWSRPAARLAWFINGEQAPVSTLVAHPPLKEPGGDKELSVLGLRILLTHAHFPSGRLKIRCTGSLAHLYWQSTENSVEVDRPRGVAAAALQTDKPPPGHLDMDLPGEAQTRRGQPPASFRKSSSPREYLVCGLVPIDGVCQVKLPQRFHPKQAPTLEMNSNQEQTKRHRSIGCGLLDNQEIRIKACFGIKAM